MAFGSPPRAQSPTGQVNSSDQASGRIKIAVGEYVVVEEANSGAVEPFGEEIYKAGETWTLWRVANG